MNNPIDAALGLQSLTTSVEDAEIVNEKIDKEYNVVEQKPIEHSVAISDARALEDETYRDIEKARKNIETIINLGDDAMHEVINLAKQSESPRAFEVASTLMKTLLDANREFIDMSTRKKYAKEEILNPKEEKETQNIVTNNNLILTTNNLLKLLKGEET